MARRERVLDGTVDRDAWDVELPCTVNGIRKAYADSQPMGPGTEFYGNGATAGPHDDPGSPHGRFEADSFRMRKECLWLADVTC